MDAPYYLHNALPLAKIFSNHVLSDLSQRLYHTNCGIMHEGNNNFHKYKNSIESVVLSVGKCHFA